jgi:hypothetical protein
MSLSAGILWLGGLIRTFAYIPIITVLGFLGLPNTRIVYKSGHVEYFLFKNVKMKYGNDGLTELNWEVFPHRTKPCFINISEVESVTELW